MQRNKVVKLLTILLSTSAAGIINYSDVKAEEIKVITSNINEEVAINSLKNIEVNSNTDIVYNEKDLNNLASTEISSSKKLTIDEYKLKSATELVEMVRTKQVTSEELVNIAYEIIERENPEYNAVITTRKELALEEAKNIQDKGQPFIGVPFLVKGIGHTVSGGENTNGLMINAGKPLSKTDSSYTKKYKELGFIVLGQTNYPELALRNITTSELYGTTTNAWDSNYHSGGSSGGSSTSISSGMVPVASGSDAGGSIRIPASWNGLIGLKTSRGMTDNAKKETQTPAVHFPITKSVQDTVTLFNYLKKAEYDSPEIKDLKSLKIGYTTKSPMGTEVSEDAINAVMKSVKFLREQGFIVEEVENPIDGREVMKDYTMLSIGNGGLVGTRFEKNLEEKNLTKENVDPLVWALYVTNKEYDRKKLKEDVTNSWTNIEKYKNTMELFHKEYPVLLTPTTATTAPLKTETLIDTKDREDLYNIENILSEERFDLLYRQWEPMLRLTPFTQIANLTGEPAISLPTYVSKENLPLGIMLNTYWGGDKILLQFASLFESNDMLKTRDTFTKNGNGTKHEVPAYDLNGDEDQDGVSNQDELEQGTDPTDKESYPTTKGAGTKHEVPAYDLNGDEDILNAIVKETDTSIENIKINEEKQLLPKTGIVAKATPLSAIVMIGLIGYIIRKRKNNYER